MFQSPPISIRCSTINWRNSTTTEWRPHKPLPLKTPAGHGWQTSSEMIWILQEVDPVVNIPKTMERSTIVHGKIHYFYGDFSIVMLVITRGYMCLLVPWQPFGEYDLDHAFTSYFFALESHHQSPPWINLALFWVGCIVIPKSVSYLAICWDHEDWW